MHETLDELIDRLISEGKSSAEIGVAINEYEEAEGKTNPLQETIEGPVEEKDSPLTPPFLDSTSLDDFSDTQEEEIDLKGVPIIDDGSDPNTFIEDTDPESPLVQQQAAQEEAIKAEEEAQATALENRQNYIEGGTQFQDANSGLTVLDEAFKTYGHSIYEDASGQLQITPDEIPDDLPINQIPGFDIAVNGLESEGRSADVYINPTTGDYYTYGEFKEIGERSKRTRQDSLTLSTETILGLPGYGDNPGYTAEELADVDENGNPKVYVKEGVDVFNAILNNNDEFQEVIQTVQDNSFDAIQAEVDGVNKKYGIKSPEDFEKFSLKDFENYEKDIREASSDILVANLNDNSRYNEIVSSAQHRSNEHIRSRIFSHFQQSYIPEDLQDIFSQETNVDLYGGYLDTARAITASGTKGLSYSLDQLLEEKADLVSRDSNEIITRNVGSGRDAVPIRLTVGQRLAQIDEEEANIEKQILKNIDSVKEFDSKLQYFPQAQFYDEDGVTVKDIFSSAKRQAVNIGTSVLLPGVGSFLIESGNIYADNVVELAQKQNNLEPHESPTNEQVLEVVKTGEGRLTSDIFGGIAAGLDLIGLGSVAKTFGKPTVRFARSLLKGEGRSALKRIAARAVPITKEVFGAALVEGVTEGLQEVAAGAAGTLIQGENKIHFDEIKEAATAGFFIGGLFGSAGKAKSLSFNGLRRVYSVIGGQDIAAVHARAQKVLQNQIAVGAIDRDTGTELYKDNERFHQAAQQIPESLSQNDKYAALRLLVERDKLQEQVEGQDVNLVKTKREQISLINTQLQYIGSKDAKLLEKIKEQSATVASTLEAELKTQPKSVVKEEAKAPVAEEVKAPVAETVETTPVAETKVEPTPVKETKVEAAPKTQQDRSLIKNLFDEKQKSVQSSGKQITATEQFQSQKQSDKRGSYRGGNLVGIVPKQGDDYVGGFTQKELEAWDKAGITPETIEGVDYLKSLVSRVRGGGVSIIPDSNLGSKAAIGVENGKTSIRFYSGQEVNRIPTKDTKFHELKHEWLWLAEQERPELVQAIFEKIQGSVFEDVWLKNNLKLYPNDTIRGLQHEISSDTFGKFLGGKPIPKLPSEVRVAFNNILNWIKEKLGLNKNVDLKNKSLKEIFELIEKEITTGSSQFTSPSTGKAYTTSGKKAVKAREKVFPTLKKTQSVSEQQAQLSELKEELENTTDRRHHEKVRLDIQTVESLVGLKDRVSGLDLKSKVPKADIKKVREGKLKEITEAEGRATFSKGVKGIASIRDNVKSNAKSGLLGKDKDGNYKLPVDNESLGLLVASHLISSIEKQQNLNKIVRRLGKDLPFKDNPKHSKDERLKRRDYMAWELLTSVMVKREDLKTSSDLDIIDLGQGASKKAALTIDILKRTDARRFLLGATLISPELTQDKNRKVWKELFYNDEAQPQLFKSGVNESGLLLVPKLSEEAQPSIEDYPLLYEAVNDSISTLMSTDRGTFDAIAVLGDSGLLTYQNDKKLSKKESEWKKAAEKYKVEKLNKKGGKSISYPNLPKELKSERAQNRKSRNALEAQKRQEEAILTKAGLSFNKDGTAKDFKTQKFLDTRTRLYEAAQDYNVQGAELAKILYNFAKSVPLEVSGWKNLGVYTGAMLNSKIGSDVKNMTKNELFQIFDDNLELIIDVGNDPSSHIDVIDNASEPGLFLKAAVAIADAVRLAEETGNPVTSSPVKIPIFVDGSNNAIQHWSALVGSPVGAKLTNISDSLQKEDSYIELQNDVWSGVPEPTVAQKAILTNVVEQLYAQDSQYFENFNALSDQITEVDEEIAQKPEADRLKELKAQRLELLSKQEDLNTAKSDWKKQHNSEIEQAFQYFLGIPEVIDIGRKLMKVPGMTHFYSAKVQRMAKSFVSSHAGKIVDSKGNDLMHYEMAKRLAKVSVGRVVKILKVEERARLKVREVVGGLADIDEDFIFNSIVTESPSGIAYRQASSYQPKFDYPGTNKRVLRGKNKNAPTVNPEIFLPGEGVKKGKAQNASGPNLVQSGDGQHVLSMRLNRSEANVNGKTEKYPLIQIFDSWATLPPFVDTMTQDLQDTFIHMYTKRVWDENAGTINEETGEPSGAWKTVDKKPKYHSPLVEILTQKIGRERAINAVAEINIVQDYTSKISEQMPDKAAAITKAISQSYVDGEFNAVTFREKLNNDSAATKALKIIAEGNLNLEDSKGGDYSFSVGGGYYRLDEAFVKEEVPTEEKQKILDTIENSEFIKDADIILKDFDYDKKSNSFIPKSGAALLGLFGLLGGIDTAFAAGDFLQTADISGTGLVLLGAGVVAISADFIYTQLRKLAARIGRALIGYSQSRSEGKTHKEAYNAFEDLKEYEDVVDIPSITKKYANDPAVARAAIVEEGQAVLKAKQYDTLTEKDLKKITNKLRKKWGGKRTTLKKAINAATLSVAKKKGKKLNIQDVQKALYEKAKGQPFVKTSVDAQVFLGTRNIDELDKTKPQLLKTINNYFKFKGVIKVDKETRLRKSKVNSAYQQEITDLQNQYSPSVLKEMNGAELVELVNRLEDLQIKARAERIYQDYMTAEAIKVKAEQFNKMVSTLEEKSGISKDDFKAFEKNEKLWKQKEFSESKNKEFFGKFWEANHLQTLFYELIGDQADVDTLQEVYRGLESSQHYADFDRERMISMFLNLVNSGKLTDSEIAANKDTTSLDQTAFVTSDGLVVTNDMAIMTYSLLKDPNNWGSLSKATGAKEFVNVAEQTISYINNEAPYTLKATAQGLSEIFEKTRTELNDVFDEWGNLAGIVRPKFPTLTEALERSKPDNHEFVRKQYELLDSLYEGKIPENIPYTPTQSDLEKKLGKAEDFLLKNSSFNGSFNEYAGFIKATTNTASIDLSDLSVAQTITSYSTSVMRTKNYLPMAKMLSRVFNEKTVRRLRVTMGSDYVDALLNSLKSQMTGKSESQISGDSWTRTADRIFTRGIANTMNLNVSSAMFQMMSATNGMIEMGTSEYFGQGWDATIDAAKILNNSTALKIRGKRGATAEIFELALEHARKKGNDGSTYHHIWSYLAEKGYAPTKYVDRIAILVSSSPYLAAKIKEHKKANPDWSQKKVEHEALIDTEIFYKDSQQATDQMRLSGDQKHFLKKYLLFYQNTNILYSQKVKRAWKELKQGTGDKGKHVREILYYGFAQRLLFPILKQAAWGHFVGFAVAAAMGIPPEEEDSDAVFGKYGILNSAIDSILIGRYGWIGTAAAVAKNTTRAVIEAKDHKKGTAVFEGLVSFSPVTSNLYRRTVGADKKYGVYGKDGEGIWNPNLRRGTNITQTLTGLPVETWMTRLEQVHDIFNTDLPAAVRFARLYASRYNLKDEVEFRTDMTWDEYLANLRKIDREVKRDSAGPVARRDYTPVRKSGTGAVKRKKIPVVKRK